MIATRSHAAASTARRPVVSPVPEGLDRPFWSVMIPTFNSGDRLARTLESVLVQDPGPADMQIRVIDDASDLDDPAALVARLAGDRVSVWRQPRNVGAPVNFTTCIQQSIGRWVHILHSDDLVLPGFYAAYREQITSRPCVMAASRTYFVDDDEQILGLSRELPPHDGVLPDAMATIARLHPFNFVAVVVARSAYEQLGGFDPALVHANDMEMWTRLAAHGPVAIVDEPLAMYRRHPDSDTNRLQRSTAYLDDVVRAIDIVAERFDDPRDGRRYRRAARHRWSTNALAVGRRSRLEGRRRASLANVAKAVRLDPTPETVRAAWDVIAGSGSAP